MFMPAVSPMYSSARLIVFALVSSGASAGEGMIPLMGRTCAGFVPQLTCGDNVVASITTSTSNCAPSSVRRFFHAATAASQSAPFGACSRPLRYSNVVSSGAIRPAFAPASMLMLQTVMRPSMESARIAEPRYSMTWPMPPPVPILPMIARMMSFAVTPSGASPSTVIDIHFGRD